MKLSDFEAVIFDMDGVLIDSEPLWKIAMENVFNSIGCPLTKKDFQKTVGLRIDEVIEYWFEHIGWKGKSQKEVEDETEEIEIGNGKAPPNQLDMERAVV